MKFAFIAVEKACFPVRALCRTLGVSRAGFYARDLAKPTFYLSPQVDEERVLGRINEAMRRCPAIVHAAEEGTSRYERVMDRALAMAGVAPPYWWFLPLLLRFPPVPGLRRRRPPLGRSGP